MVGRRKIACAIALAWLSLGAAAAETAKSESTPQSDQSARKAELRDTTLQLDQEIARLEAAHGAFDPRVSEQLLSQGRAYQQLNDHGKAVESLTRAFQIKRVNAGLYNLDNAPILQSIIAAEIARENWDAVDQNYDHLLWIYQRNYEEGDPQLLGMYDKIGHWKIQAYRDGLLEANPYAVISAASTLYAKTIELTEAKHGKTDPRLIDLHYGHALANYHSMQEFANRPVDDYVRRQGASTVTYVQQCRVVALPGGRAAQQCFTVPVVNTFAYSQAQQQQEFDIRQRFHAMRRSLERIVEIMDANPDVPASKRAAALTYLGDWHIMNRSPQSALPYYQKAHALLQSAPEGNAMLQKLFGEPVPLPALRLEVAASGKDGAPEAAPEYLTLAYDVNKDGRVHNAKIADKGNSTAVSFHRKTLQNLRGNRFRPRFENGVAVDTLGVTKRVRVPAPDRS